MSLIDAPTPLDFASPLLSFGERPLLSIDDLREMLTQKPCMSNLWLGERSALFTSVADYANGERCIHAGPGGGDMSELLRAIPRIESIAREFGCTQAQVHAGRKGWACALRGWGYDEFAVTLRKVL